MKSWILMATIVCACSAKPHVANPATNEQVAELAVRRAKLIDYLREYQERGVYPTEAGQPISVFRDAQGVRCPMAELIYRSGHADLVDAVARENNQVRLADVNEGPLYQWMLGSGLTRDEIAMVQGAMELDYSRNFIIESSPVYTAQARVGGRLETAVRVLRDNTKHSLEVASAELPNAAVPVVAKVNGAVLPKAALSSHSTIAQPIAIRVRN